MIKKFKVISHQEISLTEDIFDKIHSEILYKYPRVKQQFKKQDQLFSRGIFRETAKRLNKVPMEVYTLSKPGSDTSSTYRGYI